MKEKREDDDFEPPMNLALNINFNINNIINTGKYDNNDNIKEISIKSESEKDEIPQKKSVGPRMKQQKKNKKEDIELQIACEDAEERKERLKEEKEKKKEIILKNKNIIYKIDEENYNCVDCGKSPSKFISINNGVTLCNDCAEIHKSFGPNISYIININDELDEYLLNFIVFGSNTKFKRFLEKENVDKNISIKKKYKINAIVFYRKNLKNKVEGKKLEIKNYENPNEIFENIDINIYPEFIEYIIKNHIIKNGELKKQNKLVSFMSNIFGKRNINKRKLLLRNKSSTNEMLINNKTGNESKNKNKISMKKYPNSLDFDNDKIKESSRPFNEEKTEPDKVVETEDKPNIQPTNEQMINVNANDKK